MMKNPKTSTTYENKLDISNKELFSERIQNHVVFLTPEELSSRINDNIRQINEKTNIIHETHQELSLKLQPFQSLPKNYDMSAGDRRVELYNMGAYSAQISEIIGLCKTINGNTKDVFNHLGSLQSLKSEHTARVVEDMQLRLNMLEADVKSNLSNRIEAPEAIDTSNFVTIDQLHKSHQDLYTNIENNLKKKLSTVSTLQSELTNEINTRKILETRVTNLEEELREIRRALMFRGTIMDPLVQQQLTLNEVKQTTQETNIAVILRQFCNIL